jgi:Na+/melibiose symporter-like transporter
LFWAFVGPLIIVYGEKDTFILSAFISMIISFILIALLIPGILESEDMKERFFRGYEMEEKKEKESYWKTMKKAFKRRNFAATFLVFLLLSLRGAVYGASLIYFLKDILRLPFFYAIFFAIAGFIGFIIFVPFWVNAIQKYGPAKVMKLSLFLGIVTVLPVLWITTLEEALFFTFLGGMTTGAYTVSLGPVAADVYDECTISDGKHQEAMYEGIRTFFFRGAIIFQAIIFTIIHILTGYNPDPQAIQTPLAIWGLRIQMGLIPALLSTFAFLIMLKWYDLEGEKKLAVKMKLQELGL